MIKIFRLFLFREEISVGFGRAFLQIRFRRPS
jgi:hypothetical protein